MIIFNRVHYRKGVAHLRNFGARKFEESRDFKTESSLLTKMGSIISHRIDCNGVRPSERPAAHTHKKLD